MSDILCYLYEKGELLESLIVDRTEEGWAAKVGTGKQPAATIVKLSENKFQFRMVPKQTRLGLRNWSCDLDASSYEEAASKAIELYVVKMTEILRVIADPMQELEYWCKQHDWLYHFSDDGRVWTEAESINNRMLALVKRIGPAGKELYNAYAAKVSSLNGPDLTLK